MEHILVSHIMLHLDTNNILLDTQFSFRSKHSYELQLLLIPTDLAKSLDYPKLLIKSHIPSYFSN